MRVMMITGPLESQMDIDMQRFIWTPHGRQQQVYASRCRAKVADGERSVTFHQCARKPVIMVKGYGFCRQHAVKVQSAIERGAVELAKKKADLKERKQMEPQEVGPLDWIERIRELEHQVYTLHEMITALRTPCRCDPPGSAEKHCNGCCRVRQALQRLTQGSLIFGNADVLDLFDQAVAEVRTLGDQA